MSFVRTLRRSLAALDTWLAQRDLEPLARSPRARFELIVQFLRSFEIEADSRAYLDIERAREKFSSTPSETAAPAVLELEAHLLDALATWRAHWDSNREVAPAGPRQRYDEIVRFLRTLDMAPDARNYLEIHMNRIGVTLAAVPPPATTSRVLELGAYMQMTPALGCVLGYKEVRGAYFGEPGRVDHKSVKAGGKEVFTCEVDHFNCEKHVFPYPENHFDCVLACEIFEHMLLDPMHMLFEIHRVLADRGAIVLTTPNVASYTAVARALEQSGNPQLYSMYPYPHGEFRDTEIPHVREYTPDELKQALVAAGFEVELIFTERVDGYNSHLWIQPILERFGYSTDLRGEQMYCVARKITGAEQTRYPGFLYEGC